MSDTQQSSAPVPAGLNGLDPLLTAADVAAYLKIGKKKVYALPIAHVRLSDHRVRWFLSDVVAYARRSRRAP